MDSPLVVAVCLTADRWRHTSRAVKCFEAQTYPNKQMLLVDNGTQRYPISREHPLVSAAYTERASIGALRNTGNNMASHADIIAVWDSDDWRDPLSLAELVAELQRSGAEVVGYSDSLFFDSQNRRAYLWRSNLRDNVPKDHPVTAPGILGGSMVYWRSSWMGNEYPESGDIPGEMYAEESAFAKRLNVAAITSAPDPRPRMIVDRHAGNSSRIDLEYQCEHAPTAWKRAPEWDYFCGQSLEVA